MSSAPSTAALRYTQLIQTPGRLFPYANKAIIELASPLPYVALPEAGVSYS
ncbi:hypothetical protein L0F63_004678 [Massospora cicadina]|nr:hypothetical protein L0F63_004678 [Massospora cicadina]